MIDPRTVAAIAAALLMDQSTGNAEVREPDWDSVPFPASPRPPFGPASCPGDGKRGGWDKCVDRRERHLEARKRQRQARKRQRRKGKKK